MIAGSVKLFYMSLKDVFEDRDDSYENTVCHTLNTSVPLTTDKVLSLD